MGEPRGALQVEVKENGMRGEAVEALVREHCTAVELERYGLFVGDLERVVSLLLCLSARLARVQNALSTVDQHTDAEEKVRDCSHALNRCAFNRLIVELFSVNFTLTVLFIECVLGHCIFCCYQQCWYLQ